MKNKDVVLVLYSFFVILLSSCIWFLIKGEAFQKVLLNSFAISVVGTIIFVIGLYVSKIKNKSQLRFWLLLIYLMKH